jgi:hypothetical protein
MTAVAVLPHPGPYHTPRGAGSRAGRRSRLSPPRQLNGLRPVTFQAGNLDN